MVGDDAQLPPVGESESPALNENQMRRDFALTVATVRLTDVVRQEMDRASSSMRTACACKSRQEKRVGRNSRSTA